LPYTPYSRVFPTAAAIVHQGGSGTTGEALRAGRPQLIVPFGWDQPDNAARVERLGVGLHVPRAVWSLSTAMAALQRLLREPGFSKRASAIEARIQNENGIAVACDAVESLLKD
jgi:UDP:flavonoid glycosyltransferase YjiC (YdhE family)